MCLRWRSIAGLAGCSKIDTVWSGLVIVLGFRIGDLVWDRPWIGRLVLDCEIGVVLVLV